MKTFLKLFLTTLLPLLPCLCSADLTATVQPGYQFPLDGSVAPTYALLNELAQPTILITGTVGGSNTLAAGSVTSVQLNSSVADGTTIDFNGNNPAGLQVLSAGIFGNGLIPASVNTLSLFADTNYFQFATNSIGNTNSNTGGSTNWLTLVPLSLTDTNISPVAGIQNSKIAVQSGSLLSGGPLNFTTNGIVNTNGFNTALGPTLDLVLITNVYLITNGDTVTTVSNVTPGLVSVQFTSALYPISIPPANGMKINVSHGLGTNTPSIVRWVLVNQTASAGYQPGDELDVSSFAANTGGNPLFSTGANSTNVFLSLSTTNSFSVNSKTNGYLVATPPGDWEIKCYARP